MKLGSRHRDYAIPRPNACWLAALAIHALIFATPVFADFTGQVVSVLDGDTLEVLHHQHPERIRLNGIDCPEKGHAYGKRAKQAASELVYGKEVTLETFGKDKYRRTIADVILPHGTNVNHALVKQGWCWWYRKYAPGDTVLERLEKEAREAKKGLWADLQPVQERPGQRHATSLRRWRTRWRTKRACAK